MKTVLTTELMNLNVLGKQTEIFIQVSYFEEQEDVEGDFDFGSVEENSAYLKRWSFYK